MQILSSPSYRIQKSSEEIPLKWLKKKIPTNTIENASYFALSLTICLACWMMLNSDQDSVFSSSFFSLRFDKLKKSTYIALQKYRYLSMSIV